MATRQAERDGQIEMAALLLHIRRRHVDGNAPGRQRQADGRQGGTDPLPRLAHGLIGQADDGERGQAAGGMATWTSDRQNLDPGKGDGVHMSGHGEVMAPVPDLDGNQR